MCLRMSLKKKTDGDWFYWGADMTSSTRRTSYCRWFDGAGSFSNGFAKVKLNDKWNLINSEGQILFKQWFDDVGFLLMVLLKLS